MRMVSFKACVTCLSKAVECLRRTLSSDGLSCKDQFRGTRKLDILSTRKCVHKLQMALQDNSSVGGGLNTERAAASVRLAVVRRAMSASKPFTV